jgi:hypothetical protein
MAQQRAAESAAGSNELGCRRISYRLFAMKRGEVLLTAM